jgi:class 3 adenylate cyclase
VSFIETIERARVLLERNSRLSLRALQREFSLDEQTLAELVDELVDIQQVAVREGEVLSWAGAATGTAQQGRVAVPDRDPRDYTPKHLAEKILRSKSALEGERKQVTVMFADVKGSMELAEQLDPEAWHVILDRFFSILAEGVHRFEGTVNQYTGDGIMALFGAPIGHEDHAQRACYAALHLSDRLRQYADELRIDPGVNFSFRIGLNSGEVVVGKIGDDLRMDYTAQGHTVGLAQRMEQLAPADGIALSQHTQNAVDGFFSLRALGPVQLKGAREPVGVFVLEGIGQHRTRLDSSRARGLSRFVGRGDELAALESALQRALSGAGRVAGIVGEAGVGKSRLCAEFIDRCRAGGLTVYEAHCPAHGKTIPYLPLLELLRNLFGIADQDAPPEARQKIAGALALLDDGFADDRGLVLDFLGVADPKAPSLQLDPAVRQRRLFTFLRRLIQLRTEAEPIVLLIDDLHWIDPGSDLFLAQIVEAVSTTRTLLLVNFRPEYTADWLRKSWVLQLPMAPLSAEDLADLVRDWVGSSPSVSELPSLIAARSGGNPFFAEEIVLSLIETDRLGGARGRYELTTAIDAIEVPATVQSLLAARIDRLGERDKQLLYTAAVIGKEFARPLLESVLESDGTEIDAALSALLAAELINERAIFPVAEYSFKHPLTHEVALHAQLTTARCARHVAVADAIASAEAGRLDEFAGLLAHHWTEAGEAMRAATWHVRAARWVHLTDLVAARRHWVQARQLLIALPDTAERSRLLLEVYPELINTLDRLGAEPAESEAVFGEGVDVARDAGDRRTEALLESVYSQLKSSQNDFDSMIEHASRAVALADAEGDLASRLFARHWLGRAFAWKTRWKESLRIFDQSVAISGGDAAAEIQVLGWRPYVESLGIRGAVISLLGRPREGLEFAEKFPQLLRGSGINSDVSSAATDRFWPCWMLGDAPRARRYSDEALQMAERYGSDRNIVYALMACGNASTLALRWEEGNGFLERARQRISATGAGGEWSVFVDGHQALCLAGLGESKRSLDLARRSTEQATNDLTRSVGFLRARVLRIVNGATYLDELEAQIAETLEVLQRSDSKGLLPLLLLERAGLARLRGDADVMARDLVEARSLFAQMGATGWDDYAMSIEA